MQAAKKQIAKLVSQRQAEIGNDLDALVDRCNDTRMLQNPIGKIRVKERIRAGFEPPTWGDFSLVPEPIKTQVEEFFAEHVDDLQMLG